MRVTRNPKKFGGVEGRMLGKGKIWGMGKEDRLGTYRGLAAPGDAVAVASIPDDASLFATPTRAHGERQK
jgi:hypothetical protein